MRDTIVVRGARENNLKNIDVELPRDKFVVLTGLSGSGKSSLAFDTIYAEGQRRYVESLSSYARQFLGQMDKPDLDYIDGLSPAISIDQKTTSKNPRSTVGTVTEVYDYLRLLWARIGVPHCPKCGKEIRRQSIDQIVDRVMTLPEGTRFQVLAPVVRGKKGEHVKVLEDARRAGFVRARVDGSLYDLSEPIELDKNKKHTIDIVVDRLVMKPDLTRRLTDSIETAAHQAGGLTVINLVADDVDQMYSQNYACEDCGVSIPEMTPRMFSFNNPYGACPTCGGLGSQLCADAAIIIPNLSLSIMDGAIQASGWGNVKDDSISRMYFEALAQRYRFKLTTPLKDLSPAAMDAILYGTKGEKLKLHYERGNGRGTLEQPFEGVLNNIERRYRQTQSDAMRRELEEYMAERPCPDCHGDRLGPIPRAVTVGGMTITDFCKLSVTENLEFLNRLTLTDSEKIIAEQILKELRARLGFLQSVGLEYLTLGRASATLSGGESQRIRLATQIGSSLMGVLYILDEPSIGLHQRDNDKLLETLKRLRDLGNTLLVVEHDEDTMRAADYIVDVGPGAGIHGGEIVAQGTIEDICAAPRSITGQYLSGKRFIPVPRARRKGTGNALEFFGCRENNLKSIDVRIPLGTFTCVTGVSGSGKSSLVNGVLRAALEQKFKMADAAVPGAHKRILGLDNVDKAIVIDQSPIGRTPRSNPVTYTEAFGTIRNLFATLPDSKMRGFGPGRFSFNVKGGRCEECQGDGIKKIEMQFLPDIYVTCSACHGQRFNKETLTVRYKQRNIAEVLEMTVDEAVDFFSAIPQLHRRFKTLQEVGLGYITLGQPATTLSGGEAQRVKLATELAKQSRGHTVYILDEPTTGLHLEDIRQLLDVLIRLRDKGNTVIVIEHNLDVIKMADWIIDIGPEGGDAGGEIVAAGTPEEIVKVKNSYTGRYLREIIRNDL